MTVPGLRHGDPIGIDRAAVSPDAVGVPKAGDRGSSQAMTIDRLARWLLVAVALDLLVTRLVVRLAMFIPKDEPWATTARVLGRLGAATDVLVPIVGVLLLGALLMRAAHGGRVVERVTLLAVGLAAAGGFALVVLPTTPGLVMAIDLFAGVAAVGAVLALRHRDVVSPLVRLGLVALAAALVLVALGRALGVAEALGWVARAGSGAAAGATVGVWAQLAFVTGAGLIGLGGILAGRASGSVSRRHLALASAAAFAVAAAWVRAPATWDSLTIWSLGLGGAVPALLVAVVLGLVIAGLPSLFRASPMVALGAAIVMAAGVGLAASGLVFAGLLGLIVAGSDTSGDRAEEAPTARTVR